MIWTILAILVLLGAIALFLVSDMLIKGESIAKKAIDLVAILLIVISGTRLFFPAYRVHHYMTQTNPGILQEMVENMQKKQAEEKNKAIREFVRVNGDLMMTGAPILGNRDAKKTIFVWTDFSCPFCRRVHGDLERVLKARDDVRVVIKNFSIHGALSDGPAKAAIAAKMQDQDKAAKFIDMMMTRDFYSPEDMKDQSKLADKVEANIMKMAKEAGLDTDQLKKDMKSDAVSNELADVRDLAREFEINGTPFLIIGEEAFPGAIPYDQIMKALDK